MSPPRVPAAGQRLPCPAPVPGEACRFHPAEAGSRMYPLLNTLSLFCLGILGHYPHRCRPRLVVQQGTLAFGSREDIA